ncbi:hypothetical protein K435DRAFT_793132 [Dendrothele bispora CBS 962.96]|uniref:Uncharacterized protein n=1 Tax=Dendrothele bispora (strain CBS 962.96) TaxID=1314807 RepID=A0A4S8MG70_DENBC|nr:hypothetical protein K435DRAFT_793132 [Dendrothele bispora CBS 962.96]
MAKELMIPSAPPLPVLLRISQDRAVNPSRSSTLVEDVWLMVFKIRVVVPSSKEHAFAYPSPAVTFSSLSKYCVLFWIDDWRLMRMIITRVKPSDRCLTTSMSLMAKLYDGASASISLPVVFCINLVLSSVVGAAEESFDLLLMYIYVLLPFFNERDDCFTYPSPAVTFRNAGSSSGSMTDGFMLINILVRASEIVGLDNLLTMSLMAKLYDGAFASISLPIVFCINLVLSSVMGAAEESFDLLLMYIYVVLPFFNERDDCFTYPLPVVTFSNLSKCWVIYWADDWCLVLCRLDWPVRRDAGSKHTVVPYLLFPTVAHARSRFLKPRLSPNFIFNIPLWRRGSSERETTQRSAYTLPKEKLKDVLDDRFHAWARKEDGEEAKEEEQELKLRRLEWRTQMQWEMDQEDRKQAPTLSTRAKAPDCHNFSCNAPKDHVLDLAKIAEKWGIEDSLHSTEGLDFVGFLDA